MEKYSVVTVPMHEDRIYLSDLRDLVEATDDQPEDRYAMIYGNELRYEATS